MDRERYREMCMNLDKLLESQNVSQNRIYLFGHCNATEKLVDLLIDRELTVNAILDNNVAKQGNTYRGIPIVAPDIILKEKADEVIVCIVARAYETMKAQLHQMGFIGKVVKLADYNSYTEYSLSADTILRKYCRVERGIQLMKDVENRYPDCFKVLCPFRALGDVFLAMSYLPHWVQRRNITSYIVCCVIGAACGQVVSLFDEKYRVECFAQKDMDELVQACIYTRDEHSFIAHHDRPYIVNLHRALYIKCIPLELVYRCGVFGLSMDVEPVKPQNMQLYPDLKNIGKGKSVIFSPYAKSVTELPSNVWDKIVAYYQAEGFQCFTNVAGEEKPLEGTVGISPTIMQLQSLVEWAGTFVGIRSGLCDILKYADCDKTALYPDYNYCDTQWKAIDMYAIDGWKNIVVKDDFTWSENDAASLL